MIHLKNALKYLCYYITSQDQGEKWKNSIQEIKFTEYYSNLGQDRLSRRSLQGSFPKLLSSK